jgi:hypothetical protein
MTKQRVVIFDELGNAKVLVNPENINELVAQGALLNPDMTDVIGIPPHLWKREGNKLVPKLPNEVVMPKLHLVNPHKPDMTKIEPRLAKTDNEIVLLASSIGDVKMVIGKLVDEIEHIHAQIDRAEKIKIVDQPAPVKSMFPDETDKIEMTAMIVEQSKRFRMFNSISTFLHLVEVCALAALIQYWVRHLA